MECHGFEFHPRQLIFLWKVTAMGVLCCFALLFVRPSLLLSFFLHLSLINMYCTLTCTHTHTPYYTQIHTYMHIHTHVHQMSTRRVIFYNYSPVHVATEFLCLFDTGARGSEVGEVWPWPALREGGGGGGRGRGSSDCGMYGTCACICT